MFPCVGNDDQASCEMEQDCTWDGMDCVPTDVADACDIFEAEGPCNANDLCEWDAEEEECVEA